MAYGLLRRILQHGLDKGYWKAGDCLGDTFGGIGTTGLVGAYMGLRVVSVELESRFLQLSYDNFYLHLDRWQAMGDPLPVYMGGDSRNFAEIVRGVAGICTSPPYVSVDAGKKMTPEQAAAFLAGQRKSHPGRSDAALLNSMAGWTGTPDSPGQIAALPPGNVDAVVTSPPYAECVHSGNGIDPAKLTGNPAGKHTQALADGYGAAPGNIGNLKSGDLDGICTSPPWEDQEPSHAQGSGFVLQGGGRFVESEYGQTAGQVGNDSGDSYWQAMAMVYAQCLEALKPGGVMAVVVKRYVKGGKIVPLPDQTWQLLLHLGFQPVERIRAMLVKESSTAGLFGEIKTTKARKSFFRRLAESKGSPKIDWEDVLFVKKPDAPLFPKEAP